MIGFLDESEGVRSMTRLTMAWLLGLTSLVVGVALLYVIRTPHPDAEVLGGFAAILTALVWHGVVAVKYRNPPDDKS